MATDLDFYPQPVQNGTGSVRSSVNYCVMPSFSESNYKFDKCGVPSIFKSSDFKSNPAFGLNKS